MVIPSLDKRKEEDIMSQIKSLARQYVPEWNFDEDDPDFGVIFSKVFSKMFLDSITRYNGMPYNHYIEFLNVIGAKSFGPIPSSGMVTVNVNKNLKDAFIEKGENVYATAQNEKGRILYRTKEPMFAVNNNLKSVIVTDGEKDVISKVTDPEELKEGFCIFDCLSRENLQRHIIYFENNCVFSAEDGSEFVINFHNSFSLDEQNGLIKYFSDCNNVDWQYYSKDDWRTIDDVQMYENSGVKLKFSSSSDVCNVNGKESYFIRVVLKRLPPQTIKLTGVSCFSSQKDLAPKWLFFEDNELPSNNFFPFDEQYNFYNSFYIVSNSFNKKGAYVEVDIDFKLLKIQRDAIYPDTPIKYKNIMTELDFKGPEFPDTEIEQIQWEYWDGKSWRRLYKENKPLLSFDEKNVEQGLKISFVCPEDIEKVEIGSAFDTAIRARITKIRNMYSAKGNFISPYIKNIKVSYSYEKSHQQIDELFIISNVEEKVLHLEKNSAKSVISKAMGNDPITYFCLEEPINKAPVKIFFGIDYARNNLPSVIWQYASKDKDGLVKWLPIDVLDLTLNFQNSGIVTVIGKNDFCKTNVFGEEGFFLRIINKNGFYSSVNKSYMLPKIMNVWFNTVPVEQVERVDVETFSVDVGDVNKVCSLKEKNVLSVDVYVNEFGHLGCQEQSELLGREDTKIVRDEMGRITGIWVKWNEIDNIKTAHEEQRVFEVNYEDSSIIFGDGRSGKIPPSQNYDTIRVEYQICDGSLGNVKKDQISGFFSSVSGIDSVQNLKPITGGVDSENIDDCVKRVSRQISGVGRIVSLDDFENQITSYCRNLYRIKCVPHFNRFNEREYGTVSIAVLPNKIMQGEENFLAIENIVKGFLKEKVSLNLVKSSKINIFEVDYIKVSVDVNGVITNYDLYQRVYQEINKRVETFLDPIRGGFDGKGWSIGCMPTKELVSNYIRDIPELKYIKCINVFYKTKVRSNEKYIEKEELKNYIFSVPIFENVNIDLTLD